MESDSGSDVCTVTSDVQLLIDEFEDVDEASSENSECCDLLTDEVAKVTVQDIPPQEKPHNSHFFLMRACTIR